MNANVSQSDVILRCTNLTKSYKAGIPVLKDFNIELTGGKVIGLLGPNGCGKSTLLKLVSGILVPDSGSIEICGIPRSEDTNTFIAYLPERTYYQNSMRVEEMITYFSDFFPDFDAGTAHKMLTDLGIDKTQKFKSLSKGTKEKVQLIMTMSRRAKLYLLDEPIGGVDPAAREYILQTIIGNYSPDAAVVITTHLIQDIEPILNDFVFLDFGGRVLLSGDADEVRNEQGKTLDEIFREVFKCSKNV